MKTDYARRKLKSLLIDLDSYTNEEFEQQMLRIIAGATGQDVQDDYCIIKTERDALAAYNNSLLQCLSDIQSQCIGEIAMSFKLDPESIGRQIYKATGLTEPELRAKLRQGEVK